MDMSILLRDVFAKRSISILTWIVCAFCGQRAFAAETPKPERHVVIVVWDGMRPDFVSQENTPTLWKLASEGVVFRNHHAVYPSATNVNGTALVTGVYPGHSGLIANHVYRPEIDSKCSIDVETPAVVEKGDKLSGGKYISFPTIAEIVQKAGGRTAIATAKTVGLLLDRQVDPGRAKIALRFLPENHVRVTRSKELSTRSVHFRDSGNTVRETSGRRKRLPNFFGRMACRLFRSFGWGIRILGNMNLRPVRERRSLRSNPLMKIWRMFFRH
jgi:hypothetical protein